MFTFLGFGVNYLGRQDGYQVVIFNGMIRKHLAKKIRLEGWFEVGEGVSPVGIWRRVFQAMVAAVVTCAKALRHKDIL